MTFAPFLLLPLVALDPSAFAPWQKDVDRFAESIDVFDALNQANEYPDDSILFVGSSSIRLWETIAEDMAPYPVIRRGYGGRSFRTWRTMPTGSSRRTSFGHW